LKTLPAIHPRELPETPAWQNLQQGLTSHECSESTLREYFPERNKNSLRCCAETVEYEHSLWKATEKVEEARCAAIRVQEKISTLMKTKGRDFSRSYFY
jgi:hypothetical protein